MQLSKRIRPACFLAAAVLLLSVFSWAPVPDEAIFPWTYQSMLGRGMNVDWCKTRSGIQNYTSDTAAAFREVGIQHVRIRVRDEMSETQLFYLEQVIDDCLSAGLLPVLAYQADEFKTSPNYQTLSGVVDWWRTAAERFQDKSHLLAFDLMIECTDELNQQPDTLNQMYEQTVAAIRATNPDRIIMISPVIRSSPENLVLLEIPSQAGGFLMAEWHFYASGPSRTNEKKLWTTGTPDEQELILSKIRTALDWQEETGIPTWVGAWMPSNYNDGNDYSLSEQMQFAGFVCNALSSANIPFAVNSDTKFYDREKDGWIPEMLPLRNLIYASAAVPEG